MKKISVNARLNLFTVCWAFLSMAIIMPLTRLLMNLIPFKFEILLNEIFGYSINLTLEYILPYAFTALSAIIFLFLANNTFKLGIVAKKSNIIYACLVAFFAASLICYVVIALSDLLLLAYGNSIVPDYSSQLALDAGYSLYGTLCIIVSLSKYIISLAVMMYFYTVSLRLLNVYNKKAFRMRTWTWTLLVAIGVLLKYFENITVIWMMDYPSIANYQYHARCLVILYPFVLMLLINRKIFALNTKNDIKIAAAVPDNASEV